MYKSKRSLKVYVIFHLIMSVLRTDLLQSILSTEISWKDVLQGRRTPEEIKESFASTKRK